MEVEPVDIAVLKQFSAVILEDSSPITLPPKLAQLWRGCGGGPGASPAANKLFVRWGVLRGGRAGPRWGRGPGNDTAGRLAPESPAPRPLSFAHLRSSLAN